VEWYTVIQAFGLLSLLIYLTDSPDVNSRFLRHFRTWLIRLTKLWNMHWKKRKRFLFLTSQTSTRYYSVPFGLVTARHTLQHYGRFVTSDAAERRQFWIALLVLILARIVIPRGAWSPNENCWCQCSSLLQTQCLLSHRQQCQKELMPTHATSIHCIFSYLICQLYDKRSDYAPLSYWFCNARSCSL